MVVGSGSYIGVHVSSIYKCSEGKFERQDYFCYGGDERICQPPDNLCISGYLNDQDEQNEVTKTSSEQSGACNSLQNAVYEASEFSQRLLMAQQRCFYSEPV